MNKVTDCLDCGGECEEGKELCKLCDSLIELRTELRLTVGDYNVLEKKIMELVQKLPSYGNDCTCGDCERFDYVFYGEYRELHSVCLFCGGYVEVME